MTNDPKPCGCPDTLQTPMTVAELRAIFAEYSDAATVWVGSPAFREYRRPKPERVRVVPDEILGVKAWRYAPDSDAPDAVEGIRL